MLSRIFYGCPVRDILSAAQRHQTSLFKCSLLRQIKDKYQMTSLKHLLEIWHTSFKSLDFVFLSDTTVFFVFKGMGCCRSASQPQALFTILKNRPFFPPKERD